MFSTVAAVAVAICTQVDASYRLERCGTTTKDTKSTKPTCSKATSSRGEAAFAGGSSSLGRGLKCLRNHSRGRILVLSWRISGVVFERSLETVEIERGHDRR